MSVILSHDVLADTNRNENGGFCRHLLILDNPALLVLVLLLEWSVWIVLNGLLVD